MGLKRMLMVLSTIVFMVNSMVPGSIETKVNPPSGETQGPVVITPGGNGSSGSIGGDTGGVETEVLPKSIVLSNKELKLSLGKSFKLSVKVLPENTTSKKVKWSSSNEGVVKVDNDGNVTSVSLGQATITVKSERGNVKESCIVNVVNAPSFDEVVEFKDDNLKRAILKSINKDPNSELLLSEAKNIESLTIGGDPMVSNLEGIENLTFLKNLEILQGEIENISPLSKLVQLRELKIYNTPIKSIEPIKVLKQLRMLALCGTDVNNLSEFKYVGNLKNIQFLELRSNNINDISFISELKKLEYLNLLCNNINDISPLKSIVTLHDIDLQQNEIKDISPLKDLHNLYSVNLNFNPIDCNEDESNFITVNELIDRNVEVQCQDACINLNLNEQALNLGNKDGKLVFEIPVYITKKPLRALEGFQIKIDYDKEKLNFIGVSNGEIINGHKEVKSIVDKDGTLKILFLNNYTPNKSIKDSGELLKLYFEVNDISNINKELNVYIGIITDIESSYFADYNLKKLYLSSNFHNVKIPVSSK